MLLDSIHTFCLLLAVLPIWIFSSPQYAQVRVSFSIEFIFTFECLQWDWGLHSPAEGLIMPPDSFCSGPPILFLTRSCPSICVLAPYLSVLLTLMNIVNGGARQPWPVSSAKTWGQDPSPQILMTSALSLYMYINLNFALAQNISQV